MGLDITAYEHAKLLPEHPVEKDGRCPESEGDDEHSQAIIYKPFLASGEGLEFFTDSPDGVIVVYGRCYELSGETCRFQAGSYTGYSQWRSWLRDVACEINPENPPFKLLTYFADNAGWIGPVAARTLYDEFMENVEAAISLDTGVFWEGHYAQKFTDWLTAFKIAADTGVVIFH